jgi:GH18 family chitinase
LDLELLHLTDMGDILTTYEFQSFKEISNTKRILSFGGWSFSTDPSTYTIFREGVTAANRETMATNMANFIIANDLDGIDIDWEYPGVSDSVFLLSHFPNMTPGSRYSGHST